MNYYELLEVSPAASVEVIKNAYKTLAKKYHPDAYDGDKAFAEEKMKILNEAISVLENENSRREYNMINGIYQTSEHYGYDGANSVNINVDENGEPIFFSYSDEFEEDDDGGKKTSFMDAIDDFISNRKTKKNKTSKAKSEDLDLSDLAEVINSDHFDDDDMDNTDIIRDISELPEADNTDDLYDTQDFRTVRLPGKSTKSNAPRWYYITLACLITSIIIMFFVVLGSLNLNNVRDIINRLSGGGSPPDETEYIAPTVNYTDYTSEGEFEITTEMPIIITEIEDLTESPTEPTATLVIPPPVATPATTTPPVVRTQPPPARTQPPPPPTITEPLTEQTTEKMTEEITEEITEMPNDITETTEEPTIPEETVPEETTPEETAEPETEPDGQITEPENTENTDETVPDTVPETTDDIISTEEH